MSRGCHKRARERRVSDGEICSPTETWQEAHYPRQTVPPRFSFVAPLVVAVVLAGGCARHVNLGSLGDGADAGILWQATFEPGDLSEWESDGHGGVYTDGKAPDPVATQDQAHHGRYAGVVTFSPASATPTFSYFFREQPIPAQAYYGAWFFLPAGLDVRSFVSLLHFGYHQTAGDPSTTAIWDVDLQPDTNGSLVPRLYETGAASPVAPQPAVPVSPATWVHFELLFKKAADATGQIVAWQDGVQVMNVANVVTAPTDWIQWDVGGGSLDAITPSPLSIYVDDVTISSSRVGP
jgi:hypothetical protein